jgi:hypothetical protein
MKELSDDTAAVIIISSVVVMLFACFSIFFYSNYDFRPSPGLVEGVWLYDNPPYHQYWIFYDNGTVDCLIAGKAWDGNWRYLGNNTYCLGPDCPNYQFMLNGDELTDYNGQTYHRS